MEKGLEFEPRPETISVRLVESETIVDKFGLFNVGLQAFWRLVWKKG